MTSELTTLTPTAEATLGARVSMNLANTGSNSRKTSVLEGDIDQRLAAVMKLKDAMGIGISKEEVEAAKAKEAHKKAIHEERALQKEKEEQVLKKMTTDEGIQYREERDFSMMNKIRAKHDSQSHTGMKDSSHNSVSESGTVDTT